MVFLAHAIRLPEREILWGFDPISARSSLRKRIPPFEAARKGVIEKDYINEWTWPKPVYSANRQLRAHVACRHETDGFTAWLVVATKGGEVVAKKQAFEQAPSEFIFVPFLESVKWTGARKVTLRAKDGRR